MDMDFAKKGVANAGLTTGIIGTSLGVLNSLGGLGGLLLGGNALGGGMMPGMYAGVGCCSEDHTVNRYELGQEQKIAELQSQIALRDANTYNDQKTLELYKYIDGQLTGLRAELSRQAVLNQKTEDSFGMVSKDLSFLKSDLECQIRRERNERCCGDNAIITYVNGTFYPKAVADVTTGTTTTPQTLYNPLPNCGCGCGC